MSFRFFRFLTFSVSIALLPAGARAQDAPAQAAQTQPAAQAPAGKPAPDYPDPRTFTFGLSYWATNSGLGTEPSLFGGSQAPDYENLPNLGTPKNSPGLFISYPITRTGELKFETFLIKGTGN
ncbi:MAG TPA: hypothetical protein VEF06_13400, partial [Bryobacteraceae bacterium]|nr:hypothetical protein [Bryobacteraceae bacterium]